MCPLFFIKFVFFNVSLRDIQIFVFLSSPLFFPVSHCLRGWSKKNYKIYDIIHCLNKNLIAHFVWYIVKEIRCDMETLSMDRELNKKHFYWKFLSFLCRKFAPKVSPRPLFDFAKYPKTAILHTRNYFGNTVFLKRIVKKPLTLFFLLNPVVFNGF